METILNCLQIWVFKILQRLSVGEPVRSSPLALTSPFGSRGDAKGDRVALTSLRTPMGKLAMRSVESVGVSRQVQMPPARQAAPTTQAPVSFCKRASAIFSLGASLFLWERLAPSGYRVSPN